MTGLNSEQTPILWFRANDADGGRRILTASGVFGAAGITDAARVRIAARRMRRRVQLRMAVNPQLWGLAAAPGAFAGTDPELTITAAGAPRPLDLEAIETWM